MAIAAVAQVLALFLLPAVVVELPLPLAAASFALAERLAIYLQAKVEMLNIIL
jgi:hypothetical protein